MGEIKIDIPKEKVAQFCKKWNVRELAVFGSLLSNDFDLDSDIDVLVTFSNNAERTLFDLVRMEDELKEIFGREVDIVSRRGLETSRNHLRQRSIKDSAEVIHVS